MGQRRTRPAATPRRKPGSRVHGELAAGIGRKILDGTYPPGLPVATVARIERDAAYAFAKITLAPTAGTDRYRQVLVLSNEAKPPPPEPEPSARKPARTRRPRKAE